MKIFKNLVSVLMVLCVLLLLFSCGKTENNGETTLPDTTVKETVSATEKEKRIPTVEEVAENWEVLPDNAKYETPLFFAYFDEGYTKEYTYPGDGIDYTIYVSTSVG